MVVVDFSHWFFYKPFNIDGNIPWQSFWTSGLSFHTYKATLSYQILLPVNSMYTIFVREKKAYTLIYVMYCCITSHSKVQWLQTIIITPYLWRFCGVAWFGGSDSSSLTRFPYHITQGCSHPKAWCPGWPLAGSSPGTDDQSSYPGLSHRALSGHPGSLHGCRLPSEQVIQEDQCGLSCLALEVT